MPRKTALITGASRGIGRAIAEKLAQAGLRVLVVARHQADLNEVVNTIKAAGGEAEAFVLDVSEEKEVAKFFRETISQLPALDILVNNAGIGSFNPVLEITEAEWDSMLTVNAKATFLFSKHAVACMQTQSFGHIVTIASDAAKRTFANGAIYNASKFAQDAFLSALRKEVRPLGIKISVIYPGLVDTYFNGSTPGQHPDYLQPNDIAEAVNYVIHTPAQVVVDELMLHPLQQEY